MPIKQISREVFKKRFENSIAIVEADYLDIYFRFFISNDYNIGLAVTYRFLVIDPIREYYTIEETDQFRIKIKSAFLYISEHRDSQGSCLPAITTIINNELVRDLQDVEKSNDEDDRRDIE